MEELIPCWLRAFLTLATKVLLVRYLPFLKRNDGPVPPPLRLRYPVVAWTGHNTFPALPMNTSRRGRSRWIWIVDGLFLSSTMISAKVRWVLGSYWLSEGKVSSPALKKPKKHTDITAHSMQPSKASKADESQTSLSFDKIGRWLELWVYLIVLVWL